MPQNKPQNPYADLFSVAGKTAVITGGSSGLGLAMAEAYLRCGARVYITGRKAEPLAAARAGTRGVRRRAGRPGRRRHARRRGGAARCAGGRGQAARPDQQRRHHLGHVDREVPGRGVGFGDGRQREGALSCWSRRSCAQLQAAATDGRPRPRDQHRFGVRRHQPGAARLVVRGQQGRDPPAAPRCSRRNSRRAASS